MLGPSPSMTKAILSSSTINACLKKDCLFFRQALMVFVTVSLNGGGVTVISRPFGQLLPVEKGGQRIVLFGGAFQAVQLAALGVTFGQTRQIPADVFAGDAYTGNFAVKSVHFGNVFQQSGGRFVELGRRRQAAFGQIVADIAEQPRLALCGAADHYAVGAGLAQDVGGFLRAA